MKIKNTKVTAVALAAILTVSALMGCAAKNDKGTETSEKNQTQEDTGDKFRPSELGTFPQEKYEYPYLGLNAVLTKTLLEKMESRDVMMITDEDCSDDGRLRYAAMYWYSLTEEQKNEEVEDFDPYAWIEKLAGIGVLGVYSTEAAGELDELTGCTEHKELGKSEDGEYTYYLSYADTADENLKKELEKTEVTLIPMQKLEAGTGITAFSDGRADTSETGSFKTTDVNGKEYTEELFGEYDLTLVNVFTTWCSPCVEEMPELEKFKKEMEAKGVNIVGIVCDSVNEAGEPDQQAVEKAKALAEKTGLTFPLLMPDETGMNGRLKGIGSFPESFFVDRNGNIVGETYVGSNTAEGWKEIAEKELANLKGEE